MSDSHQWFLLLHRPGPAVGAGQSVFEHPGIADHYAFLGRRQEDGTLVAAGPLEDADGDGLTVLAVASLEQARELAEHDDRSVEAGVLAVTVRPWHVVMAPITGSG